MPAGCEKFNDFFVGKLTPSESEEFCRHTGDCRRCRWRLIGHGVRHLDVYADVSDEFPDTRSPAFVSTLTRRLRNLGWQPIKGLPPSADRNIEPTPAVHYHASVPVF